MGVSTDCDRETPAQALVKAAGAETAGAPIGVHPGFAVNAAGLTAELRKLLAQNTDMKHLAAVAMMGISTPEPWIFFTLARQKDGSFEQFPHPSLQGQKAEMFAFASPHVVPMPSNAMSTARVFNSTGAGGFDLSESQLASPVSPQVLAPDGQPVKLRDIPEFVANPKSANCELRYRFSSKYFRKIPSSDSLLAVRKLILYMKLASSCSVDL